MDIISPEVASGAGGATGLIALLKAFYNDIVYRQEKRDIQTRLNQQDDEIASHAVLDAQTFITKDEFNDLRSYLDTKFLHIENMVIGAIKDGAKAEDWRNRNN